MNEENIKNNKNKYLFFNIYLWYPLRFFKFYNGRDYND